MSGLAVAVVFFIAAVGFCSTLLLAAALVVGKRADLDSDRTLREAREHERACGQRRHAPRQLVGRPHGHR